MSLAAADLDAPPRDLPEDSARTRGLVGEIVGGAIVLLAMFLGASLAVGRVNPQLVGPVGMGLAGGVQFLLGEWLPFALPVTLGWFGVSIFMARLSGWTPSRLLGIFLLMMATAGSLALPYADDAESRALAFSLAGAFGTFLVEWDGLRLVGMFGSMGAAMVFILAAMIGLVLITQWRLSEMALWLMPSRKDSTDASSAITDDAIPVARVMAKEAPADAAGVLPGIFRRDRRTALLAEPDPEELGDVEAAEFLDPEAALVARIADEARIDAEYERALRRESSGDTDMDEAPVVSGIATPVVEAPRPAAASSVAKSEATIPAWEQPGIVFNDPASAPARIVEGNPADARGRVTVPVPAPETKVMEQGLAKLFPEKWAPVEKPAAKSSEEVRNAGEERMLRQTAAKPAPKAALASDDPLFDEQLDTRPAGPIAAMEAATRSGASSDDDPLTLRNRALAEYRLPNVQLLDDPPRVDTRMPREEMLEISTLLEKTFADFGIEVKVTEVTQGPVVTRFELKPAAGVKVSRIVGLEHDIALAMRAVSVRIVAPIPGKAAVGIEVPNRNRQGVYLKELVACPEFWDHPSPLAFALGKTIDGAPYFVDLKKMPHLLIAGATGAGKSVCLNTLICSFLYRQRPDRLRLLMVDPKRVELSVYQNIPHLISPVVCDAKRAAAALAWAVEQMEARYKKLVDFNVRNIDGYNEIAANPEKQAKFRGMNMDHMPHMVIIVDELADLMVVAKAEVEESIQRLAQMARAVGMHLILATQRPSVNVITGIIKANFPTRIAFQVSQKVDSRTILDGNGAEALLGRGDMLYAPAGAGKPIRVQGAFLSDEEVERIASHCRAMSAPMYEVEEFEPMLSEKEQREIARMMGGSVSAEDLEMQGVMRGTNKTMGKVKEGLFVAHGGGSAGAGDDEIDEALVRAAARVILEGRKGSTSLVQRRLKVGFARAGRLMDMLEGMGIVGAYKGSKPRDIMVDPDAALAQLDALESAGAKKWNPGDAPNVEELDGEAED